MDYARSLSGRPDFIGCIDNEALDFGQLESFIHVASNTSTSVNGSVSVNSTPSHLPESPPDSGSEPPYSPIDLHGLNLAPSNVNQLTELHLTNACTNGNQTTNSDYQQDTVLPTKNLEQSVLELNNVGEIHGSVYLNGDLDVSNQATTNGIAASGGLCLKNKDILLSAGNTASHDQVLQQEPTLLELSGHHVRPYLERSTSDILTLNGSPSVQPLSPDDLSRLLPIAHHIYHHSGTISPATVTTGGRRKRKIGLQELRQVQLVKPEPGSVSPAICHSSIEPHSPSPNLGGLCSQIDSVAADQSTQNSDSGDSCSMQCIRFSPFQQQNWHLLCDQALQDLPIPHYRVDADKGFNFSNSDEAFVCQKKNHFQITCHAQLQGSAVFIRTSSGLEKIKSFHLHFYGVKLEAPTQTIRVEQSQSDRSKKPFHPVLIDLQNRQVSKVTVGRLHFSETTSNNMRKKGRPNPEQRYFQLVVGLHAHTQSGHFPVISHGSEKIIVRASNPGQFESDVELCWQRGVTQDSIYHAGRVGINTDRPDESLVVNGNLKISGHIVQPSDSRAKEKIITLNTMQQLKNIQRIRVVKYRYQPQFAIHSGLATVNDCDDVVDTGVIAQEVRKILPDAVKEAGSVRLPDGFVIDNFLVVNKDRLFMENIGAVQELCKMTGKLKRRIESMECRLNDLRNGEKVCAINNRKQQYNSKCRQIFMLSLAICLAIFTTIYYNSTLNPMNHFKNWLNIPANQFKSIVPLCGPESSPDDNESYELLRASYQYRNNVSDTGQGDEAGNVRLWNLSKELPAKMFDHSNETQCFI